MKFSLRFKSEPDKCCEEPKEVFFVETKGGFRFEDKEGRILIDGDGFNSSGSIILCKDVGHVVYFVKGWETDDWAQYKLCKW